MSRYVIQTSSSGSLFSVFAPTVTLSTSTLVRINNTDGTITEIVGVGLTLSGATATGGTITSITRLTSVGGTVRDVFDLPNAGLADSFVSFWNAADNIARRQYLLGQADTITGAAGNDRLFGDDNGDLMSGGAGNDTFFGGLGNDTLNGGDGDDEFFGGPGTDSYSGGDGTDVVLYRSPGDSVGVFANLGPTSQTINGNTRNAFSGNDGAGNLETYLSIEGIEGTVFNDTLVGGNEDNWFRGSAGNDTIIGNGGFDEMNFQALASATGVGFANDVPNTGILVTYTGGSSGTVNNDGWGGTDSFSSIERVRGTQFNDTVNGDETDNSFRGLAGNDSFNGGGGNDEIDYRNDAFTQWALGSGAGSVTIDLAAGTAIDGFGNNDVFTSVEFARGGQNNDTIGGSAANNRLRGQDGNDLINGLAGNDTLDGENGNDTLNGGDGSDTLIGGAGNDVINGGLAGNSGGDTVRYDLDAGNGGPGAVNVNLATGIAIDGFGGTDTLVSIEYVNGTNGNDTIIGDGASNIFNGFAGNDSMVGGRGSDFFTTHAGNDTVDGSNGGAPNTSGFDSDTVSYHNVGATAGVVIDMNVGTAQKTIAGVAFTDTLIDIERFRGTAFGDSFRGSDTTNLRQERFEGLGGADTINGGAGFDIIRHDNDQRFGGLAAGITARLDLGTVIDGFGQTDQISNIEGVIGTGFADFVQGNAQRNTFRGRDGADTFNGGDGIDQLQMYFDDSIGGAGVLVELWANRGFSLTGAQITLSSVEDVAGSYRNDTLVGDGGDNALSGDLGNDLLFGGGGNDILGGSGGQDTLNGEAGFDLVSYNFDPFEIQDFLADLSVTDPALNWGTQNWIWGGVNANLQTGVAIGPDGATDTLIDIEGLVGTFFNDTLVGNSFANEFWGQAGNDSISGGGGIDTVRYDTWTANGRVEALINGVTATVVNGVVVNLLTGQANDGAGGQDTLSGIENVIGSAGGDDIFGNAENNLLILLEGNDTGNGAGGNDTIFGFTGNDLIFGGAGNDDLLGEQGSDTLIGEDGNDTLNGGDGDDILYGWLGNDLLFGGAGFDRIFGEQDDDVIVALEGNDTAFGGDGLDVLFGWLGADELWGGAGADQIFGEQDNDLLFGEDGNDTLFGGEGNDTMFGWQGVDILWGGLGADVMFGEQDNDVLLGEDGDDVLLGGDGDDALYGWFGNDSLYGWVGNDLLLGEDGNDFMLGEGGNDTLNGGLGDDFLGGQEGDDLLLGFEGNDTVFGDDGNDFLGGLSGNDVLVGGAGFDTMWGDGGDDRFVFRSFDLANGVVDVINSFGEAAGNFDRIALEGIAANTVTITQQGGDTLLSIALAGGAATIRVTNFNAAAILDQIDYI